MGGPIKRGRAWIAGAVATLPLSLRVVLVLGLVLHGVGLWWGMPASDGWDNDGIAPRDILPGLAATYTPGDFYTYPPAHLLLLSVLTLPATVVALVRAPSLRLPEVIHVIIAPPYMTAFTMTARLVALAMSLGITIALAKIAEEISGDDPARKEHVATFTAAVASVGVTFTYYAHTSNLDVPSLFWASLAALAIVRTIVRQEPQRLRRAAIFGALALATKDQTYALFVISVPLLLGGWLLVEPWPRANWRRLAREAALALAIGAAVLLVVDGAIVNPSGFRARIAFLRGPASQDFSNYTSDLDGRIALLTEIGRQFGRHYPPPFAAFIALGLVLAVRGVRGARVVAALLPLTCAISFTVGFNFPARRIDDRFLLPQMLFLAIYAGFAFERVWSWSVSARIVPRAACVILFAIALWEALRVDLTFLYEPRYRTEAFLERAVASGDTIEVHGRNVYLPRFPDRARVVRVGQTPVKRRGPLPGVEEVEAPLLAIEHRAPRFVVVSQCYVWRYLAPDTSAKDGRVYPTGQLREAADVDARQFFEALFAGGLDYHAVHVARIEDGWFRPIEIHASLNCKTTTFERNSAP